MTTATTSQSAFASADAYCSVWVAPLGAHPEDKSQWRKVGSVGIKGGRCYPSSPLKNFYPTKTRTRDTVYATSRKLASASLNGSAAVGCQFDAKHHQVSVRLMGV